MCYRFRFIPAIVAVSGLLLCSCGGSRSPEEHLPDDLRALLDSVPPGNPYDHHLDSAPDDGCIRMRVRTRTIWATTSSTPKPGKKSSCPVKASPEWNSSRTETSAKLWYMPLPTLCSLAKCPPRWFSRSPTPNQIGRAHV